MLLRENGLVNKDGKKEYELHLCSNYDQFNLLSSGSICTPTVITIKFHPNTVLYYCDDAGNNHSIDEIIEKLESVAFIFISNSYEDGTGAIYTVKSFEKCNDSYILFSVGVYTKI